eukprot:SAG25_NODE_272_length_10613_cov_6.416191_7_plen_102_part_00
MTAGGRRGGGGVMDVQHELRGRAVSRRPFPSWARCWSILAEIFLCRACSCQEILRADTAAQGFGSGARARGGRAASAQAPSYIPAHMQAAQVRPVDPLDIS